MRNLFMWKYKRGLIRIPLIPYNEARGATCTKSVAQRSMYTSDTATKLKGINGIRITKTLYLFLVLTTYAHAKPLHIVTTVPYLADLVDNITCHNSNYVIHSLIPNGIDPHTYILAPKDRILIKNAGAIIQIGAGLEKWLDKIPIEKGQKRLILSQHLNLRKMRETSSTNKNELLLDPHIWQSPKLTEDAVLQLSQFLISQDQNNKNQIEACTQKYVENIHATVEELKKQIDTIPKENRLLATNHDSLGYFAIYFNLKIYTILGLSDEEQPSPKQLQNLILALQQHHIKSIFLEATGNPKSIQTVASNAHIKINGILYGDSFGQKGSNADTTIKLWKSNTETLVRALR